MGIGIFEGFVSLENNGGFASVRSQDALFDLRDYQGIAVRLKGDGKRYKLSIKNNTQWDGIYYYYEFITKKDQWNTVFAPFTEFVPMFRGRIVPEAPSLDPKKVASLGFMISGKQEGAFTLMIDWIKAVTTSEKNAG